MSSPIGDMVVKIVGDNTSFDKSIDNSSVKFQKFGDLALNIGKGLTGWINFTNSWSWCCCIKVCWSNAIISSFI